MFPMTGRSYYRMVNGPPSSNPFNKRIDTQYSRGINYWAQDSTVKPVMSDKYLSDGTTKSGYARKLQISNPSTGQTKMYEIDSEYAFLGKRIGQQISGDLIPGIPELNGCKLQITGATNFTGKPYHPSILKLGEVKPLIKAGDFGFQKWRRNRDGDRRRRRVMGCFLDRTVRSISMKLLEDDSIQQVIHGLSDRMVRTKTLGPKRASKIRKLFNLSKLDDVRKYVIKRPVVICKKNDMKGVKIQRLVTPERIRRKTKQLKERMKRNLRRSMERKEYEQLYCKKSHSRVVH